MRNEIKTEKYKIFNKNNLKAKKKNNFLMNNIISFSPRIQRKKVQLHSFLGNCFAYVSSLKQHGGNLESGGKHRGTSERTCMKFYTVP